MSSLYLIGPLKGAADNYTCGPGHVFVIELVWGHRTDWAMLVISSSGGHQSDIPIGDPRIDPCLVIQGARFVGQDDECEGADG